MLAPVIGPPRAANMSCGGCGPFPAIGPSDFLLPTSRLRLRVDMSHIHLQTLSYGRPLSKCVTRDVADGCSSPCHAGAYDGDDDDEAESGRRTAGHEDMHRQGPRPPVRSGAYADGVGSCCSAIFINRRIVGTIFYPSLQAGDAANKTRLKQILKLTFNTPLTLVCRYNTVQLLRASICSQTLNRQACDESRSTQERMIYTRPSSTSLTSAG